MQLFSGEDKDLNVGSDEAAIEGIFESTEGPDHASKGSDVISFNASISSCERRLFWEFRRS